MSSCVAGIAYAPPNDAKMGSPLCAVNVGSVSILTDSTRRFVGDTLRCLVWQRFLLSFPRQEESPAPSINVAGAKRHPRIAHLALGYPKRRQPLALGPSEDFRRVSTFPPSCSGGPHLSSQGLASVSTLLQTYILHKY